VTHYYELGYRLAVPSRDPHNLYLWLLLQVGLLGTIPFLGGLSICWTSAWKGRRSRQGVLPLAMLVYYLLINLKGTYLDKYFWIVLAYTLATNIQYPISWRGFNRTFVVPANTHRRLVRVRKNVFQHMTSIKGKLA
jgi:O-antigen ligase